METACYFSQQKLNKNSTICFLFWIYVDLTLSAPIATIVDLLKIPTCTRPCWHIHPVFFWYCSNRTYYKAISTNQCLVPCPQHSFHISYRYQKGNMFDPNTTTQLLANLRDTPCVLKLNIFLWLQAIIHDNFRNLYGNVFHIESICLYQDCSYTENLSYTERLLTETFNWDWCLTNWDSQYRNSLSWKLIFSWKYMKQSQYRQTDSTFNCLQLFQIVQYFKEIFHMNTT